MKLEKIEINGFKSFADKTTILLDGAITGIVGPNGSGKSNIADAVRWVLGEQNSRNLRGVKMEDVIFGGTQTRRAKAYCEVSLYFDNADHKIDAAYSEIVVTRKMFRSGESEYLLNRTPVRLKDILDIVRDTGIGREGYSIVGQGKIDELLSAKPGARRKAFEEAAGVMKFRTRKEEAEGKLQRTQENLLRIGDILEELQAQLSPLGTQAEKTRTYLGLFERQKFLEANLFLINYERVQTRLTKLKSDLSEIEREIRQEKARFGDAAAESEALSERIQVLGASVASLREQYEQVLTEAEQASAEKNIARERLAAAERDAQRLREEADDAAQQGAEMLSRRQEADDARQGAAARLDALREEMTVQQHLCDELSAAQVRRQQELEQARAQHLYALEEKNRAAQVLAAADAREEGAAASAQQAKVQAAHWEAELSAAQTAAAELSRTAAEAMAREGELTAQEAANREEARQILRQQKAAEQQAGAARAQQQEAASRKAFLEKLKQEYEGYSQGVRNLMRAQQQSPADFPGLLGTLAELLEIPKEYEKAMEAALGGALQNVVVRRDTEAKQAIDFLRTRRMGRVSFMPLSSLRVRRLSRQEEALLLPDMQRADTVVTCADEIRPAVEYLLARTVVVPDMDAAIALARRAGQSFRIVTREGDLINPGGVMTGGSMQQRNFGLLSRDREIEQAATRAQAQQAAYRQAQAQMTALTQQMEEKQRRDAEIQQALRTLAIEQAETRTKQANLSRQIAEIQERCDAERRRLQEIALDAQKEEAARGQLRAQVETWQAQIAQALSRQRQLEEELDAQDEAAAKKLADMRLEEARLQNEIARGEETARSWMTQAAALQKTVLQKQTAAAALEAQREALREQGAAQEALQAQKREQVEALRTQIAEQEAERSRASETLLRLQQQGTEYQLRQAELAENKYKLESQLERLSLSMENAQNKLWEDYGMTYGEAEKLREPLSYAESARELQGIREQIRTLGPINPNAIEEFEQLSHRVADMAAQKQDLEKAKADLEVLIQNILSSMRVVFREKFHQIGENFQEIFRELFGGGRAEIALQEGDIMECGIDITAEPPGKKLQHISLLSGGERALTGIALLFAMIRINPAPLCLLDEIDAPLDEANVVRFGNYVRKIPDSQFLIITHRKPTMAICPVLFGVTMEEKGVSKLVSVKIEEKE